MDPIRDSSKKGFLNPQVMAAIGLILGIILGLVYGWVISPVELIDLSVTQLRDDLKVEYLRIAIDSYTLTGDATLAKTRYDRLGEDKRSYLAEVEFNPAGQTKSEISSFRELVEIEIGGEAPGEILDESSEEKSGIDILKWALLIVIALAGALIVRYFLRKRSLSHTAPPRVVSEDPVPAISMENTIKTEGMEKVIEVNKLTKYYGKARGIVDVSFTVNEGEIFGFIGPNGAGKSTTIRLFLSLIYPTSGEAKIFGKDCIKYGPEIRQDIGYLPSEVFYYEGMKVLDLLKYSASFYKKDCTDRLYELADLMELDLKRRIDDLSYGNKKKVGIVQGLLHSPKLIVLDEPTAGLDPLMQQNFFNLIREENQRGATVFFSSHILGEVQRMCNRVAIIKDGSIINIQDIKTLQKDNYKKIRIVADSLEEKDINFDGVSNLHRDDGALNFFYKGDINRVSQLISKLQLTDVVIEEPTLEEIFIHYYE